MVKERRSVLLSGFLSFLFGPIGWCYAAPWKVAAVGGGLYLLVASILPQFLLVYVVGIVAPLSSIAGIVYAIGFNVAGKRTPMFGKDEDEPKRIAAK